MIKLKIMIKKSTLSILFLVFAIALQAQTLTQSINGRVVDKDAESPLPGVNVVIIGSNPQIATSTDVDGYYTLKNVPIGRVNISFTFIGYKSFTMNGLLLSTGKELVINPKMEENITEIQEVQVTANSGKEQPMNKMAVVSARSFSIEETERYAGSLGDPSRMAQNFAGVVSAGDQRNDIVIRGNSPSGLLWKLDGVPIPNPNHFGSQGSTGGPVSMLNNNLLTNSDFFTGAWPAEYNNSVSGVFDLKMRNGNTEKREYLGQIGYGGVEVGTEGPFVKGKKATYLVNYRYSTMAFAEKIGLNPLGVTPNYQDISMRINIPTKSLGTFSFSGIAGNSSITLPHNLKSSYGNDTLHDIITGSDMATAILSNTYIKNNWTIKSYISVNGTRTNLQLDNMIYQQDSMNRWSISNKRLFYKEQSTETRALAGVKINKKINAQNNITIGGLVTSYNINFYDTFWKNNYSFLQYNQLPSAIDTFTSAMNVKKNNIMFYQVYAQYQHRFNEFVTFYTGVNGELFALNNSYSIDPRASLKYQFTDKQSFNLGYGHHSQLQPLFVYITQSTSDYVHYEQTNKNIGMTKSNHFIVGYDYQIAKNLRLKVETYYQQLYNVPIKDMNDAIALNPESQKYQERAMISMLNYGADFYTPRFDSLVNKGTGKNYGVEFTLEKFFSNHFYFLSTTSLFQSKYKTPYAPERNTVFNGNFVWNLLGGYELKLGKGNALAFDLKNIWAGGKRRINIDLAKSIAAGETVYDYTNIFGSRYKDYFRFDLRISYKMNKQKFAQEWALDMQNLTNQKNIYMEQFLYNRLKPQDSKISYAYQIGFYPMVTYRLTF